MALPKKTNTKTVKKTTATKPKKQTAVTKTPALTTTISRTSKGTKKKVKAPASKNQKKSKQNSSLQSSQSFLAFLGLLVMSGFLVGGLFASFSFYQDLITPKNNTADSDQLLTLPLTGESIQEDTIPQPLPPAVIPGNGIDNTVDTSTTQPDAQVGSPAVTDPRQPQGTTEFKDGNYKVYQYPDGRIIVVW